ncbi:Rcs stress response system protein RcsF [Celerinatantimonas diazotrophica]|uniref:RcsF protein n=1 Tax=Celerinatantimonas diazotrophica TaxID=412034 RepID=A0A4R1J9L6_9GAMM|nr:Rcs stress response system protein RcsF [Celerinatantimonas diazotrophica]TCK47305.1 RcsF protein [Celerinatantimonas diazotrophica]CAG9296078.1 Outer membrane lipoprotein RcsF [Celerinatantimonas diazotrophica]
MKKTLLVRSVLLTATFLLSACSSQDYQVKSNLDPHNIKEYFKTSGVQVMSPHELLTHNYKVIGTIEGDSCQEKSNQPPADIVHARVDILNKAANRHADAVVFAHCISFPADNVCLSSVSCFAKAVKLLDK